MIHTALQATAFAVIICISTPASAEMSKEFDDLSGAFIVLDAEYGMLKHHGRLMFSGMRKDMLDRARRAPTARSRKALQKAADEAGRYLVRIDALLREADPLLEKCGALVHTLIYDLDAPPGSPAHRAYRAAVKAAPGCTAKCNELRARIERVQPDGEEDAALMERVRKLFAEARAKEQNPQAAELLSLEVE